MIPAGKFIRDGDLHFHDRSSSAGLCLVMACGSVRPAILNESSLESRRGSCL